MRESGRLSDVVENGFCVGCGVCAAMDAGIRIEKDEMGRYAAVLPVDREPARLAENSCPFARSNPDEDQISEALFSSADGQRDPFAGAFLATYAGWVTEGDFRQSGSSGGMSSWLLCELLDRKVVDHVLHVEGVDPDLESGDDPPLFRFTVSSSPESVRAGAKSRYYPVEMSAVLHEVLERPGRYAVVGVPCFIKALRLAALQSETLRDRLTLTVGIVCGHLKSAAFAELLGWQCGVLPDDLKAIDFRVKFPDSPATQYGVTVQGGRKARPASVTRPMRGMFGGSWGHGFFKYNACDYCDDVLAETADIVFGDAWLPEYEDDSRGTNVVLVRNPRLLSLLQDAAGAGRLHLESVPVSKVVESQLGGFRHRRDGLAYRLWLDDKAGRWRPEKRTRPSYKHLSPKLRRIYRMRMKLARASHHAFADAKKRGHLDQFLSAMRPLIRQYDRQYRRSLVRRAAGVLGRYCSRLLGSGRDPADAGNRRA